MSVTDSMEPTARDGPHDALRGAAPDAVHEIGAASVDADNPWLGLASFTEESQAYFFGREGEVAELTRRVQRKLLTVLFGKSGLGKTSILRAGLVPRLRAQGYFPVYLRIDYGRESPEPAEQIKQAINKAAATGQWTKANVTDPAESIWEFLHHRDDVLKDKSGATLIPLLIFDQFEELFTLAQTDEFGRTRAARFIEELADLVENRPSKALEAKLDSDDSIAERFDFGRSDYRVAIALREDYLAPLESLKRVMPSLSQNRLRLAPMTGTQALEAVLQPGNRLRPGKPLVSEEVAEAIVRFVAGGSELANAEVEPSLLSLICRELNEQRITQGRSEISQDLLAGSHETILSTFYERALSDQPEAVRRIIEDDLLTESGYRENLAEESLLRRFRTAGAAPDALAKLVNRRLLRIEERLDVRRVELTHDVLTGIVKASRDERHEREAKAATERALAEQRAREEAAHRALRRTRAIAAGCTLLAALALAAAIFAFVSFRRARHAELIAQQTRTVSDQARREAEGLLGFLTDDFVTELKTFGRYQTIAELAQREIDYFQHLPPQLEGPETARSDAYALVDHASALDELGQHSTADRNDAQAIALLESLRRTDKSDATTVALGSAYLDRCFNLISEGRARATGTYPDCQRAAALLRPVGGRVGAPTRARDRYLQALGYLGLEDLNRGQEEAAVQVTREALRIEIPLTTPENSGKSIAALHVIAGTYLTVALAGLGRDEEARRAGEETLPVANEYLAQHPQSGPILSTTIVLLSDGLSYVAANELDAAEDIRFTMQDVQMARTLVGVEPKNFIYHFDLGGAYWSLGWALWQAGRLREAIGNLRHAEESDGEAASGFAAALNDLVRLTGEAVSFQAKLGDFSGTAATVTAAAAYLSPRVFSNAGPVGQAAAAAFDAARAYAAATVAYEHRDLATAQRIAHRAVAQLEVHRTNGELTFAMNDMECDLSDLEAHAEYALGDFESAARAESLALKGCKANAGANVSDQRTVAQPAIWLSMALAREGKRADAAQTIAPIVTMYGGLMKRNHGDQWLPLEFAEALYAQSLADPPRRTALLRQARGLVDHLIPAIARLHDTREWRARIEAAQRASGVTPTR